MKNKLRHVFWFSLCTGIAVIISLLMNQDHAANTVDEYYQSILRHDYDRAYEHLSRATSQQVSLEEYQGYSKVYAEVSELVSVEVHHSTKRDNPTLNGKTYEAVYDVEKTLTMISHNNGNKKVTDTEKVVVVKENGEYRVDIAEGLRAYIAYTYIEAGKLYQTGTGGRPKDPRIAVERIRTALQFRQGANDYLFLATHLFFAKGDLAEVIDAADKALAVGGNDRNVQSNAHMIKGLVYLYQGKKKEAQQEYETAMAAKPDQEMTDLWLQLKAAIDK
ncbi:tetratricopeptide repeat protein [Brevibacillus dissolubilis]|uniref:tetratricopeptide repeat protein n=1 Tax=Brevibacillus dissolubilis TaxID=1844116 RepID=UPI001117AC93|nr:hypothetical protein [Brevibacillus dissolubilis]